MTDLGDQVGAYADITDPDATAHDFSATAAPVVPTVLVTEPRHSDSTDGSDADGYDGSDADADESSAKDKAKAKADSAEEEAAGVAGDAKTAATDVAGSAKEQATKVASEAADQAKQVFGQATSELKEQAGAQQEKAAAGLRAMGEQLGSMADDGESGVAGELVRNLSGRAHGVAEWLEGRDAGTLLDDVKSFAARKPGTFIAIAAASGLLAGRVVKSLTAEAKQQHEAEAEQASAEKASSEQVDPTGSRGGAATHPRLLRPPPDPPVSSETSAPWPASTTSSRRASCPTSSRHRGTPAPPPAPGPGPQGPACERSVRRSPDTGRPAPRRRRRRPRSESC